MALQTPPQLQHKVKHPPSSTKQLTRIIPPPAARGYVSYACLDAVDGIVHEPP